jgi:hypothetical protein
MSVDEVIDFLALDNAFHEKAASDSAEVEWLARFKGR